MANIQKTLDSLQPYVIGIRYLEGTVLVDAVFKEGWTVIDDPNIGKEKGNDEYNYYMIFSTKPNIGLDELLAYVDRVIKHNIEREKKHDLLREKVNELKELFKKNSLSKLMNLRFTFKEEDLVPNLNEFDVDIDEPTPAPTPAQSTTNIDEYEEEETVISPPTGQPTSYLDENGKPIELTDEERELLEEEARAERNRQLLSKQKKPKPVNNMASKVELPPKRKPELVPTTNLETDCDCGPDEACDKCIDSKGL